MDWQTELARQGPFVMIFGLILLLGHRKVWIFAREQAAIEAADAKVIAEKDKTILEKDKALEILRTSYEARLQEKDEECGRERARVAKSEGFTDRLLMASIDAVAIASRATQVVTSKEGA